MEKIHASCCFSFPILIFFLLLPLSFGQLTPSENRILFRVQQLLEFPSVLQGWNNWTNFCYLPPSPSLTVVCSGTYITELTIVGNKNSSSLTPKLAQAKFSVSQETLTEEFSIDSLFTTLTKLSSLKVLSLVSLGLWGPLPTKIKRFWSLESLNLSSNFLYGEIPRSISTFQNLSSLVLSNNLFNGTVPDLSGLAVLEELDLSNNFLGQKVPSMAINLVSIVLRNNNFRSEIPSKLSNFDQLQRLDISSNEFVGPIPSSLFSLSSIQYLDFSGNKLTGALPKNLSCSNGLEFVDLSHNFLIGRLPLCVGSNSSNRIILYSWNCLSGVNLNYQHPSSSCQKEALAVKPPLRNLEKESNNQIGLKFGIAGGAIGGLVVLGLLIFVIFRNVIAKKEEDRKFGKSITEKTSIRSSPRLFTNARHVSSAMRLGAFGLPPYHVFTLEEIEEATNSFDPSCLMGEGSQGKLYKGWIRDGSMAVVRCVKLKQKHSPQSLLQQMEVISKLRHRHLVSIIGHCIDTYPDYPNAVSTVFLVFEHVSNGTLRSHLTDWRNREMLKWQQRMAVIIGVARGIQFLHIGIAPGIVGNDFKIENILLDENLTAKISNYNLPLPSRAGSENPFNGAETLKQISSVAFTEQDDIYQLGVILLEIITGKPITSPSEIDEMKLQLEKSLADAPARLRGATDPSIHGTFAYESLKIAVEITINCLSKDPNRRPSIEDVLWNLQYSVQVQEGWLSSGNLGIQP